MLLDLAGQVGRLSLPGGGILTSPVQIMHRTPASRRGIGFEEVPTCNGSAPWAPGCGVGCRAGCGAWGAGPITHVVMRSAQEHGRDLNHLDGNELREGTQTLRKCNMWKPSRYQSSPVVIEDSVRVGPPVSTVAVHTPACSGDRSISDSTHTRTRAHRPTWDRSTWAQIDHVCSRVRLSPLGDPEQAHADLCYSFQRHAALKSPPKFQ